MKKERFLEIEKRNSADKTKMCFELHSESFKPLDYNIFKQVFTQWVQFFSGGSIDDCIAYFKRNKVTN